MIRRSKRKSTWVASKGSRAKLAWSFLRESFELSCKCTPQRRIDPTAIKPHRTDDFRDLRCVSVKEPLDQPCCLGGLLILDDPVMNGIPGKNSNSQDGEGEDTSDCMHTTGTLHHPALRQIPVLLFGQHPDIRPLHEGRQAVVIWLGIPESRELGQSNLGSSSRSFPLLAGKPVT